MSQLVQRYFRKKDKKMEENEVEKVTKEIAELRNLLRDALTTVWWNNQRGQIDFYELPAELLDEQPSTILTPNEPNKNVVFSSGARHVGAESSNEDRN